MRTDRCNLMSSVLCSECCDIYVDATITSQNRPVTVCSEQGRDSSPQSCESMNGGLRLPCAGLFVKWTENVCLLQF
jgi:hypothetical protein